MKTQDNLHHCQQEMKSRKQSMKTQDNLHHCQQEMKSRKQSTAIYRGRLEIHLRLRDLKDLDRIADYNGLTPAGFASQAVESAIASRREVLQRLKTKSEDQKQ